MNIYFAARVKYFIETEEGMRPKTEYALVSAISVSDAETKVIKHYTETIKAADVSVLSVGPSQICTVVPATN